MSALDYQVAGEHYSKLKYQPLELSHNLKMWGIQLLILKYITRYRDKNGKEDLTKAIHCCQIAKDLNDIPFYKQKRYITDYIKPLYNLRISRYDKYIIREVLRYCHHNKIYHPFRSIVYLAQGKYSTCITEIYKLLDNFDNDKR